MVMQRAFVAILAFSSGSLCEAEPLPPGDGSVPSPVGMRRIGREIFDDSFVRPNIDRDQVSHYDTKSNRCYVEIDTQTRSPPFVFQRYLYDGQLGSCWQRRGLKETKGRGVSWIAAIRLRPGRMTSTTTRKLTSTPG